MLSVGLALSLGLITGAVLMWLVGRNRQNTLHDSLVEELRSTVDDEREKCEAANLEVRALQEEVAGQKTRVAELTTLLSEHRKHAEEKLVLLNQARQELADTFKIISAESLQKNNQSFLELAKETMINLQDKAQNDLQKNRQALGEVVKPLQESLGKMDVQVKEVEKERLLAYAGLTEQVKSLAASQATLQGQTANLVQALRTPSVRGRWGEIQLKRVVELAGMLEYCDFVEQQSVDTESGRLRPDMVVHLPGKKNIVVDSKVALQAYIEALEAETEEEKTVKLAEHARQIRTHIQQLSSKSYWEQFQPSPELVVLFLPGENFFSAALQQDAELIEFGVEQRVILATPTTLIALLKAVSYGWRQEQITDHAVRISELGKDLHERIRVMTGHFLDMRKGLERTVESFNRSVGSYEGRVLVAARKFRDLDPLVKKEIPSLETIDLAPRDIRNESGEAQQ